MNKSNIAELRKKPPPDPSGRIGVIAHAVCFFAVLFALWMVLVLSALIPNAALQENFTQSALAFSQAEAFQFCDGERLNAIGDNYADAILLNLSWNMGEGNPFVSSIDTNYYDGEDLGENAGLYLTVTEGVQPNTDYTRYWHGSAAFVRLLHLFTDVGGIRWIGLSAGLLLAALSAGLLIRRKHPDLALLLVLSLVAVQMWNIRLSMEYQPAVILTFLLCPLYLQAERKGEGWLTLLSVAGGAATAFFDFLTTETLTILLPLILVTAVRAKEGRLPPIRQAFLTCLKCGIGWVCAYAGTFLVKWTLAWLITGGNAFALALNSAGQRVGVIETLNGTVPAGFLPAVSANLTVLFGGTERVQPERVIVGLLIWLSLLGSVWYLFRAKEPMRDAALPLLIMGAMVPLRFVVLNNHSYLHEFFTYRALASTILALLAALRLNVTLPGKSGRMPERR